MARSKILWGTPNLSPRKKFKNDLFLTAVILTAAVLLFAVFSLLGKEGDFAVVIRNGKEVARYPLSENLSIDISEEEGMINRLVIENGSAKISFANCPDLICAKHKAIKKSGETIVCLPHKVVIKIESEKSEKSADIQTR